MKTVKLSHITPPDPTTNKTARKRFYHCYLGNYCMFQFPSDKSARKFLVDRSRELTRIMRSVNTLLPDLVRIHRSLWIYDDAQAPYLLDLLHSIYHDMDTATGHHRIEDSVKVGAVARISESLTEFCHIASKFFFSRTLYELQHATDLLPITVQTLWHEFDTYRHLHSLPTDHKEMPSHLDPDAQIELARQLLHQKKVL